MLRRASLVALCLVPLSFLTACYGDVPAPDKVAFIGRLIDGTALDNNTVQVVPGAQAFATTTGGSPLASSVTDVNGNFNVGGLAKNIPVDLIFSDPAASYGRAVFPGETQGRDSLLFTGSVFLYTSAALAAAVDEYRTALGTTSGLMTINLATNGAGAMVRGRVVTLLQFGSGSFVYCNRAGAKVTVTDGAGSSYRVFYRDNFPTTGGDGPIDPSRTSTGDDARFIAFGVKTTGGNMQMGFPVGPIQVAVTQTASTFTCVVNNVAYAVSSPSASYTQSTLAADNGLTVLDLFTMP